MLSCSIWEYFYVCIPASAADAADFNPNGIKKVLANGFDTFFIKSKSVFSNGNKSLNRNPSDCSMLDN